MNKNFVPFTASAPGVAPGETGSHTKVVVDSKCVQAFRPVTDGTLASAPVMGGEPKVTLERDGDRITRIKIQCGCGNSTELVCDY